MSGCFIDRFDVILLDMVDTFMFGCDRFQEDTAATYARIGGRSLPPGQVRQILGDLFRSLWGLYTTPSYYERFPSVREHLGTLAEASRLADEELDLLERTFALHEVGNVPAAHAEELEQLRQCKRLGVISDIWSDSKHYLKVLEHAGICRLMDIMVFSSDHGAVKPSQRLFDLGADHFSCDRSSMVYIGDYFERDVFGAKRAGMATVWINAKGADSPHPTMRPDLEIGSLLELRGA